MYNYIPLTTHNKEKTMKHVPVPDANAVLASSTLPHFQLTVIIQKLAA